MKKTEKKTDILASSADLLQEITDDAARKAKRRRAQKEAAAKKADKDDVTPQRQKVVVKQPAAKKATRRAKAERPARKKAPQTDKGTRIKATRAVTKKGSTPSARKLDSSIVKVLEEAGHPVSLPVQVSHPKACVRSGLYMLDLILSGGFRKGRMYTILGHSGHGKSTLLQEALAAAQRQGIRIFHFDLEASSARNYMARQGIIGDDSYRLADGSRGYYYLQPETGEEFYRTAIRLCRALPEDRSDDTPPKTIILLDSYESMDSEAISEDKAPIGSYARMHSQWQKKLRRNIVKAGAVLVATNQLRTSGIGSFFVNQEDDAGGYALRFYADVRVFLRTKAMQKEGTLKGVSLGSVQTKKSKVCDPFKKEEVRLIIGRGFDRLYDRLALMVQTGHIKKDKARFKIGSKTYQYRAARALMKQREWREKCEEVAALSATYRDYFKPAPLMLEEWDTDE